MIGFLKNDSIHLLTKCLAKYRPDLLWILETPEEIMVDEKLGNELRDAVGNELISAGFDGCNPNEYGLQLEELMNQIGILFL